MKKFEIIKKAYFFLITVLVLFIIITPSLINDGFSIFSEEMIEGTIIAFLIAIGFIINFLYERELKKHQNDLKEAWKHIGKVNLLVERFKTAIVDVYKYPENKNDLRALFEKMAEKIAEIAGYQFVMFRVVDMDNLKTLTEYIETKNGKENIKIGNKELIEGVAIAGTEVFHSQAQNSKIRTFCVLPKIKIDKNQNIFIQKIVSDFNMAYIVYTYLL